MGDCSKCKVKKKDGLVGCEGPCNKWFHYTCINLTESDFKLLDKSKNLLYLCDLCRNKCEVLDKVETTKLFKNIESKVSELTSNLNIEGIKKSIQKQYDILLNEFYNQFTTFKSELEQTVLSRIDDINKNMQNVVDIMPQSRSYASIASTSKSSFILMPKNSEQLNSVTKSDMLRNIDPVGTNINISQVKNTRNGGVVVSCGDGDESAKFKELAKEKLGDKYDAKQLPTLNPRVKVVGMSEEFEEQILLDYIKKQNNHLFVTNSICQIVNVAPLRKNRKVYQATLQLDKVTYNKILTCGKLFVGYDYCSVYDAVDLRRCYKCCGFHHIASKCTLDRPICPKCSEFHSVKDCKAELLKCVHCSKLKTTQDLDINTDHAVWDQNCHVYKETLKKFKANIMGSGTD